ncbi:MAG: prepilin-type N-terminal cleavage/methylation domain-containing protein [Fimbriimonadales bacterium]|nr:prepilin-type N-terminal cleavage/methylation domain-containing protein [Fimbriimonadales bacterium]MDW8051473.1 prepilin-type N-terminal cleavage/methylation domain-containing protein [Armatimonadota bacterium]
MRRGFTLVELLTVIAIIAILAAIIFPVAGTVRENARRSRCMANLSQIYVALQTYKEDFRAYPFVLGAYAVDANGNPTCDPSRAVPFDRAPKPLGSYLKNDEIFHCPNNPIDDKRSVVRAIYPRGHALAGQPVRFGTGRPDSPEVCFYAYDSYSIGRVPRGNDFVYELRYTLFWSNQSLNEAENRLRGTDYGRGYYDEPVGPKGTDNPRQLGYRNPDTTTVVTWCTYHRSYRGDTPVRAKDDIVLFLTGNVKVVDSQQMFQLPYLMYP